jgi:chromosome segregation ATPase
MQNQNQNQEKAASRIEKAIANEKAMQEKAASRMEELEKELAKLKAEKAASRKAEKAAKEELASVKKALSSKLGEIDILARTMIEESKRKPQGWTRKELLASYLAALGMDEANEKSVLKEATLNAQCGNRIQPRLEKLGYKLARAASDMGKALYICIPLKG